MVLQQQHERYLFHRKADEASRPKSEKFLKYLAEKKASKYYYPPAGGSSVVGDAGSITRLGDRSPRVPETASSSFPSPATIAAAGGGAAGSSVAFTTTTPPNSIVTTATDAGRTRPEQGVVAAASLPHDADHYHVKIIAPNNNNKKKKQQDDDACSSLHSNTSSTTVTPPFTVSISHQDRAAFLSKLAASTGVMTNKDNNKDTKKTAPTSFSCSSSHYDFSPRSTTARETREAREQQQESDITSFDESRNPPSSDWIRSQDDQFISEEEERHSSSFQQHWQGRRRRGDSFSSQRNVNHDAIPSPKGGVAPFVTKHHSRTSSRPLSISQRVAKASRYSAIKEARRASTTISTSSNNTSLQQQQELNNINNKNHFLFDEEAETKISRQHFSQRPRSPSPHRPKRDMDQCYSYKNTNENDPVLMLDRYPSERGAVTLDRYPSERAVVTMSPRPNTPTNLQRRNSGTGWNGTMPPFVKKLSDLLMGNDIEASSHDEGLDIPPISSIEIGPVPTVNSLETNI